MALDRLTKITGPGIRTDTNWVGNNANFTGVTTTGSSFNVGISTFHSTLAEVHNIVSTGVITATSFSGDGSALTGVANTDFVVGTAITMGTANFTGNVTIGGTLTYEDVTNIDSVGIITAQKDIHVGAGVSAVGVGTFGSLDIGGDLDVDGHTNLDNVSIAGITTGGGFKTAGTSSDAGATNGFTAGRINIYDNGSHNIFRMGTHPSFAPAVWQASSITFSTNVFHIRNSATTRSYIDINNTTGILKLGFGAGTNHGYKLETSAKGIKVGTGVTIETNGQAEVAGITTFYKDVHIKSGTNRLYLGTNDRLSLIADPSHSYLRINGGHFQIHNNNFSVRSYDGNGSVMLFYSPLNDGNEGGGPRLRHYHGAGLTIERLRTTKSGVNITGVTTTTGLAVTGVSTFTGNIVPSSDSATDIGTNSVRFANIYADTLYGDGSNLTGIVNANVAANAAIAGSKITPNFGSQTLTAGLVYSTALNSTGTLSLTGSTTNINFNRASHTPTYRIRLTGGSYPTMNFRIQDTTNTEDRFIIRHGGQIEIPGDVGIGHPVNFSTTNISKFGSYSTLHIKGPSNEGAAIRLQDNGDTADSDDFVIYKNYAAAYLRVNGTDPLKFYMNGADRVVIDSSGRVLIGTSIQGTSGADKLTLSTGGSTGITIRSGSSNDGNLYFAMGTTGNETYRGFIQYEHSNNAFRFGTNATERLRIDSAGQVLPGSDATQDLGNSSKRWRNVYTTDLQLSNVGGGGNEVDGTEGNWTLQEGESHIYMINRKTGKKYVMMLKEVD